MARQNSIKSKLILSAIIVCICAMVVLGISIYNEWKVNAQGEEEYKALRELADKTQATEPEQSNEQQGRPEAEQTPQQIDYGYIPEKAIPAGDNIIGWIYNEGTVIDYPVMQGNDNEYYLNHLYNGKYSKVGSIFMDYRNDSGLNDKNTILYGHHMRSGKMFASLENYKDQTFYEEHPVMYYYTKDATYRIEIFAAVVINGEIGLPVSFDGDEDFNDYLADVRQKSAIQSNVEVDVNDKIVTMGACTYDYYNARITVIGKLVKV